MTEQEFTECDLCGEPIRTDSAGYPIDEAAEFYDPSRETGSARHAEAGVPDYPGHVVAHAQCGIDAGLELA